MSRRHIFRAGYNVFVWEEIANTFAGSVRDGDWSRCKALYDSAVGVGDDNLFAVYLGVPSPTRAGRKATPDGGGQPARLRQAPFATWATPGSTPPMPLLARAIEDSGRHRRSTVRSTLLLDETLDAATPFEGGLEVRARFPGST